jgi:hypothetical protein
MNLNIFVYEQVDTETEMTDFISVDEFLQTQFSILTLSVFDEISAGFDDLEMVDSVIVSEFTDVQSSGVLQFLASDDVAVTESAAVARDLRINVGQFISITEVPSIDFTFIDGVSSIDVASDVSVTEFVFGISGLVMFASEGISAEDVFTSEFASLELHLLGTDPLPDGNFPRDNIGIWYPEPIAISLTTLNLFVFESLTIVDFASRSEAGIAIEVISLVDIAQMSLDVLSVRVEEPFAVLLTEHVDVVDLVVEVGIVVDAVTISENISANEDQQNVIVSDAVFVTELYMSALTLAVDVFDSILITESAASTMNIAVNALDAVAVTEIIGLSKTIVELGLVFDAVAVTENIQTSKSIAILVFDTIIVTEFKQQSLSILNVQAMASGIDLLLHLDQLAVGTFVDSGDWKFPIAISGSVVVDSAIKAFGAGSAKWGAGAGAHLSFNDPKGIINVSGDFDLEMRVYFQDVPTSHGLFWVHQDENNYLEFFIDDYVGFQVLRVNALAGGVSKTGPNMLLGLLGNLSSGQFYTIGIKKHGNEFRSYVNGVLADTVNIFPGFFSGPATVFIGDSHSGFTFGENNRIDEVYFKTGLGWTLDGYEVSTAPYPDSYSDLVTVLESATQSLSIFNVTVADAVSVADVIIVNNILVILGTVFSSIAIVESAQLNPSLSVSVISSVTVIEFVNLVDIIIELGPVYDVAAISENAQTSLPVIISLSDVIAVAEFINIVKIVLNVGIAQDSIAVIENVLVTLPILTVNKFEVVSIIEVGQIFYPFVTLATAVDTVAVVEHVAVATNTLSLEAQELITALEQFLRDMPINFEVAEQKGIAIIRVAGW